MKNSVALLSLLLLVFSSQSWAVQCLKAQSGTARFEPANEQDFLKHYLYLNLAFPQHDHTIRAGLAAFFLSREIRYDQMVRDFSQQEWEQVNQAMLRSHQAHGIDRVVKKRELDYVISSFVKRMPTVLGNIVQFYAHPKKLKTAEIQDLKEQLARREIPRFQEQYEKSRIYAQTVLKALRSPEIRDISVRFRNSISSNSNLPSNQQIDPQNIAVLIEDIVVAKLIEAHPELAVPVLNEAGQFRYRPDRTMAWFFYQSITFPSF